MCNKEIDAQKAKVDTSKGNFFCSYDNLSDKQPPEFKISKEKNCEEDDDMFEWVDFKKYGNELYFLISFLD